LIICNLNHNKHDTSYYIAWVWDSLKRDWPSLFNDSTAKNWNDKIDIIKANNPFKPIPSLNWGQESLTKDFSSSNVENTMDLMDLTIQDIMAIPNDKLCEQVKIAEYLKSKALTEANTGISNAEKAQLLDFYNNTTLIDPCTGEEIDKDEIFSGLCASGEMSLAGLNTALDGVDKIIINNKTLSMHCPNFKSIYEYLVNSGNKLFCDKLYLNFEYDENITVNITGFNQPGGAEGATTYSDGGKTINIAINKITCNNPLSIAATLIHESIHAALYKDAKLKDPTITREDIIKTLRLNTKTTDPDHEVMAKKYVNLLAESLREADGNRFPVDYYLYLAWSGIQNAGYELELLNDPWIGQFKEKHDILMSTPNTFCK